jgi:hypothetical protein
MTWSSGTAIDCSSCDVRHLQGALSVHARKRKSYWRRSLRFLSEQE